MKRKLIENNLVICFSIMILYLLKTGDACAQNSQLDSLRNELKTAKVDTTKANILNEIAWIQRKARPNDAIDTAQKSIVISKKNNFTKGEGYSLIIIGVAKMVLGEFDEAMNVLNEAISICEKSGDKRRMALAYNNIGVIYYFKSDYTAALKNHQIAFKIRDEIKDKKGVGDSYYNMGIIYSDQGNYLQAEKNYDLALKAMQETNELAGIADVYNSIGILNQEQGNYSESLKNYFSSLKIKEKIGNQNSIAVAQNNIGIVYHKLNNHTESLKYAFSALKIFEKFDDKRGVALSYQNIGNVYNAQGNFKDAVKYHKASLKSKKELSDVRGIAHSYIGIGIASERQKNYSEALKNYFNALKIQEEIKDRNGIATSMHDIGFVYLVQSDFDKAEKYLKDALSISREIGNKELIKSGYISLSELDSAKASSPSVTIQNKMLYWQNAYNNYKQYSKIKDSLFNEDKTKEIARQEMYYEQEKKDAIAKIEQDRKEAKANAEIEKQKLIRNAIVGGAGIIIFFSLFLFRFNKRKRDAEQKQKEASINLQISETEMKALRSQMNPHFIFNALQSIQAFLLSHKQDDANTYLLKFSKLMRLVLENSQHSEVSLKEDMQALELYMQLESIRLKHPFTYQFHIEDGIDIEETSIPPLILQPFVENAIWHGLQYKPEPGHIDVYISKKGDTLHATVEDNGVGRDMSKKVAQPMLLKKESLGMKLTEERLKILNELKRVKAHFTIKDLFTKDEKPAGTKVELSLPLA